MGDERSEFFKKNGAKWADPNESALKAGCGTWFNAMSGALVIGVGLPVLLVNISYGFLSLYRPDGMVSLGQRFGETLQLMIVGSIFCSPGVAVLGSIVLAASLNSARRGESWKEVLWSMCLLGGLLAFLNLPGYLCLELLGREPGIKFVKVVILFVVAGVSASAWIARVAWRVSHPQDSWLPAFSLTTLMILVLVWAGVMGVFAPR